MKTTSDFKMTFLHCSLITTSVILYLACRNETAQPISAAITPAMENRGASRHDKTVTRTTLLVLPPYDPIANEGISPPLQKYLHEALSRDSAFNCIAFPYKLLSNVPYHNVYDKKYCKPILEKINTDVIVMTKLDQLKKTGNMSMDKWSLQISVYYPDTDRQIRSTVTFKNLTDDELYDSILEKRRELAAEIHSHLTNR